MYFAFQISVRLGDGGPGQTPREWLQNARKPAFQPLRDFYTLPQNLATARKTGHTAILWGFDGALRVRVGVDGGDGHGFLAVGGADLADAQGNLTDLRSKSNCIAMGAIPSPLIASCCHWTLIG